MKNEENELEKISNKRLKKLIEDALRNPLISHCGICCSLCPAYMIGKCPGCPELKDCKIVQCGESKGQRYCFLCNQFPCHLFEEGFDWDLSKMPEFAKLGIVNWKPFSRIYIKLFKFAKLNNLI